MLGGPQADPSAPSHPLLCWHAAQLPAMCRKGTGTAVRPAPASGGATAPPPSAPAAHHGGMVIGTEELRRGAPEAHVCRAPSGQKGQGWVGRTTCGGAVRAGGPQCRRSSECKLDAAGACMAAKMQAPAHEGAVRSAGCPSSPRSPPNSAIGVVNCASKQRHSSSELHSDERGADWRRGADLRLSWHCCRFSITASAACSSPAAPACLPAARRRPAAAA